MGKLRAHLTRPQAAEKLGVSVRTMRDKEKSGELVPDVGEPGEARRYSLLTIAEYQRRRAKPSAKPRTLPGLSDELAAAVFEALVNGKTKIEIVRYLQIHPDEVEKLALTYAKMKREEDQTIPPSVCVKCGASTARFCGGCVG